MTNFMNKTLYLKIVLIVSSAFFLNGCDRISDRVKNSLENNVYWSDSNNLIEFTFQGTRKNVGTGSIMIGEERVEGMFSFGAHYCDLTFSIAIEMGLMKSRDFPIDYYSENKMIIRTERQEEGFSRYGKQLTLERRKLSENNLDAKYFIGSGWQDEFDNLHIYYAYSPTWSCEGRLFGEKFDFNFLENKHFSIVFPDGDMVLGTYLSFKDGSIMLKVSEGYRLFEFGNNIKLTNKTK